METWMKKVDLQEDIDFHQVLLIEDPFGDSSGDKNSHF